MPNRLHITRARTLLLVVGALVLLAAAGVGFLGWNASAADGRIPNGVTIAGIDVGDRTAQEARALLRHTLGRPARRPLKVKLGDKLIELTSDEAGVALAYNAAIRRALEHGEDGNFIARGWRELTGGEVDANERIRVALDSRAVTAFLEQIGQTVDRPAVDAQLQLSVDDVSVSPSQDGSRLADPERLRKQVISALRKPRGKRSFEAETVAVKPETTAEEVWAAHPTVVTISKATTTVRVFSEGELVTSYSVAVGSPEYPTPSGQFSVQTMQVDPPWNVPESEWAGDLAGQTIPGGSPDNPLVARWIGFNGAVGFHGTNNSGSIGTPASHGCVRMSPPDVIDLYDRVDIGTTVYVA